MSISDQLLSFNPNEELFNTHKKNPLEKVDRYKWNKDLGKEGRFALLDKAFLKVDRTYQREGLSQKILEIASDWKWTACGAISVMLRADGSYLVVDGQHRVLAAWKRADIKQLPCMVFDSSGIESEASAFVDINTKRKAIQAYTKFSAKVIAGDRDAVDVKNILESHDLRLTASSAGTGTIACVALCQKLYKKDVNSFIYTVHIAAMLAAEEHVGVCNMLLAGLDLFNRKIPGGLKNPRLIEKLRTVGAKALVDSARKMSYRIGKGGEYVWAEGMLEIVNRGIRSKFTFTA